MVLQSELESDTNTSTEELATETTLDPDSVVDFKNVQSVFDLKMDSSTQVADITMADFVFDEESRYANFLTLWNEFTALPNPGGEFAAFATPHATANKEFVCVSEALGYTKCDTNQEYSSELYMRSWTSCFFGHNKNEWRQRPYWMIVGLCRKHYQRITYDAEHNHEASTDLKSIPHLQLRLIRAQLDKDQEWRPHALYKVQLAKALTVEINKFNDLVAQGQSEENAYAKIDENRAALWTAKVAKSKLKEKGDSQAQKQKTDSQAQEQETDSRTQHQKTNKNRPSKTPAHTTPIRLAVELHRNVIGPDFDKNLHYVRCVLDFLESKLLDGSLTQLPALEFLLHYREEDKRRKDALRKFKERVDKKKRTPVKIVKNNLVEGNTEGFDEETTANDISTYDINTPETIPKVKANSTDVRKARVTPAKANMTIAKPVKANTTPTKPAEVKNTKKVKSPKLKMATTSVAFVVDARDKAEESKPQTLMTESSAFISDDSNRSTDYAETPTFTAINRTQRQYQRLSDEEFEHFYVDAHGDSRVNILMEAAEEHSTLAPTSTKRGKRKAAENVTGEQSEVKRRKHAG